MRIVSAVSKEEDETMESKVSVHTKEPTDSDSNKSIKLDKQFEVTFN